MQYSKLFLKEAKQGRIARERVLTDPVDRRSGDRRVLTQARPSDARSTPSADIEEGSGIPAEGLIACSPDRRWRAANVVNVRI
jgi:hypothetical protein